MFHTFIANMSLIPMFRLIILRIYFSNDKKKESRNQWQKFIQCLKQKKHLTWIHINNCLLIKHTGILGCRNSLKWFRWYFFSGDFTHHPEKNDKKDSVQSFHISCTSEVQYQLRRFLLFFCFVSFREKLCQNFVITLYVILNKFISDSFKVVNRNKFQPQIHLFLTFLPAD